MKGKILVSILALGASSIVLANGGHIATTPTAVAAEPNYFDGFVVGLDGSMQHLTGSVNDNTTYTNEESETPQRAAVLATWQGPSSNLDVGDNTLGGGIFTGYGKVFNSNYYLGGEIYARYAHSTISSNSSGDFNPAPIKANFIRPPNMNLSTSINIDTDWAYGAVLKLGYLMMPKTMIYLLAGVECSKFEVDVKHILLSNAQNPKATPSGWTATNSFNKNKFAFVPGIGIETMLTNNLSLKGEYTYADYGSFSGSNSNSLTEHDTVAIASSTDKVSLKRGLYTLGLAYHFNGI